MTYARAVGRLTGNTTEKLDEPRFNRPDVQSPSMMIRRSSGRSVAFQVGEIADLYRAVRKARHHLQLAAHGLDVATQRGEVHIRAFLQLGDGGLLDVQYFSQHLLR
jgi:hypothetical protein